MKKVITLDRARRRGIMEGRLKDIENFPKLNEDFFMDRKSSLNAGHNDKSIVSNGI